MVKTHPIACTKDEMNALIDASIDNEFYYMLFTVAKTTGRRLGEYYNVKVGDADLEKGVMMTQVLKRRKRIEKEAILTPEVARLIRQYIKRNALKQTDYLFRKVSYRQIQNKIKTYAKDAGITHNVSFHNFRHYFVTELYRKGWTYDQIAKLTGHSTPQTLVMYDHTVATDIKDKALNALRDI